MMDKKNYKKSIKLAKSGKFKEAFELAYKIENKTLKSQALSEIRLEAEKKISQLAKSGKFKEAFELLNKIDKVTWTKIFPRLREDLSKTVFKMIDVGKIDEALHLSKEIKNDYALFKLALYIDKKGKSNEALEIAKMIKDNHWWSEASSKISANIGKKRKRKTIKNLSQLVEAGKTDEALKMADNSEILIGVAIEMSKEGKFNEALEVANKISNKTAKSKALSQIAIEMSKEGKFNEALEVANKIRDKSAKYYILSLREPNIEKLILQVIEKEGVDEALKIASKIRDKSAKSKALSKVALKMAEERKIEGALKIASKIPYQRERLKILSEIGQDFARKSSKAPIGKPSRKNKRKRATIIVDMDKGILLDSHTHHKKYGKPLYCLPGGSIQTEKGEPGIAAAARLLKWETGLYTKKCSYLFDWETKSTIHKVYLIEPVGEISKGNHISHIDFYNDQSYS